ncbi:unnamed protein product [Vitrella brassicaformis CCMP3155]|uniref:Superoxide dismutase n=2 Tax=Vitrella brassicaformis TaxID=1169539 RepID=A0A0G4H2G3_VITBC|nr:unnamed protein product [Vitrella brassicaformis CCMP3155]|mmetsp:Transcript_18881/g.45471  ORF Transcript_18881/g.45471 Transcript_18881/m.45471 type:complete len:244 (+) Transcript_18881:209-940(+)|eukprot:CEM37809.1 unnamed protein product [Vitrella brassicaformis CCMP3155]
MKMARALVGVLVMAVAAVAGPETNGQYEQKHLPYDFDFLEPAIDTKTMFVHWSTHYAGYVRNINLVVAEDENASAIVDKPLEIIQRDITTLGPFARNNAGGAYNHGFFWTILTSVSSSSQMKPSPALQAAIDKAFGSFDAMKESFSTAAKSVFGSGWAWLAVKDGELFVVSTANQNNPLMKGVNGRQEVLIPILGLDVWEHAYYLKYQNRRAEYIDAFWGIVNWDKVSQYFEEFASKGKPVPV